VSSMLMVLILGLEWVLGPGVAGPATPGVEVSTTTLTIATYPYAGFLHTHHSESYNMDYLWLDWSAYDASGPPSPRDYTALVVENPWLRLTFLPELGGRLYGVTVKATGEELLYQNPVLKPTHWGPTEQGWWLAAGGIEWCLPVDEHGYEWGVPWSYHVTTTAEGATISLWDTEATDRLRANITFFLPADRAAFQITPRLENPTSMPVALKFWDNAMLAPGAANTVGQDLRFVLPTDQVTVHSRGDGYLPGPGEAMAWPTFNGIDLSRLGNWNQWLGFFARPQAAEDWAGVYAQGVQRGVARIFPHDVAVGVKGFGLGWASPIDPSTWTDDGSFYVELHGGPSPTFWDAVTLSAGQLLEWTETWLPLRGLPALSTATPEAALGLKAGGADLDLGVVLARAANGLSVRLWRQTDCALLWHEDGLDFSPGEVYSRQVAGLGLGPDQVVLDVFDGTKTLIATGDLTCQLPESQVDPLDTVQTSAHFLVTWSATDPSGVLAGFDIAVRDGDADAPWTDWLTGTTETSATFSGQDGHTYTFRSRAWDLFGNVEDWPLDGWQDTFTTVLLEPAPVLITSEKVAQPLHVSAGEVMAFQVHVDNTGNLRAGVQITDPLPAYLTLTAGPYSSLPPQPVYLSDTHTILWSGTVSAGQLDVTIGFAAEVLYVPPGGTITNAVWIDDGVHPVLRRQVTATGWRQVYLPIILKE
jgi:uncharacterized repeat protein (TIGR01451 family)